MRRTARIRHLERLGLELLGEDLDNALLALVRLARGCLCAGRGSVQEALLARGRK